MNAPIHPAGSGPGCVSGDLALRGCPVRDSQARAVRGHTDVFGILEDKSIPLRIFAHPFDPMRCERASASEGDSLLSIVSRFFPMEAHGNLRVTLRGGRVPREHYERVRPRRGQMVGVRLVLAGNDEFGDPFLGKPELAQILGIASSAGGLIVGGLIGGPLGMVAQVGISILGMMAAMQLVPPPMSSEFDLNQAIQGFRNRLAQNSIVPQPYGKILVYPPHAAIPYTLNAGNRQEMRALFVIGAGEFRLSELKIGETPITNFPGVITDERSGGTDQVLSTLPPFALYPNDVQQETIDTDLPTESRVEGETFPLDLDDRWVERTTDPDADEIIVGVEFHSGLFRVDNVNAVREYTIALEVQYRPTGGTAWHPVGAFDAPYISEVSLATNNAQVFTWLETLEGLIGDTLANIDALPDVQEVLTEVMKANLDRITFAVNIKLPATAAQDGAQQTILDDIDGHVTTYTANSSGWDIVEDDATDPDMQGHLDALVALFNGVSVLCNVNTFVLADFGDRLYTTRDWVRWVDLQEQIAGIFVAESFVEWEITRAERGIARASRQWFVEQAQYDVRVRRITEYRHNSKFGEDVTWSTLTTVKIQDPMPRQGFTTIAIKVAATDQVSGVLQSFNCIAEAILPVWDEAASDYEDWPKEVTANPAWAYCHVLMSDAVARRPVAQARVDMVRMKAWADYCDEQGFEFSSTFNTDTTSYDARVAIALMGRARPIHRDSLWSIVFDAPITSQPVTIVTPRNSKGFTEFNPLDEVPHAIKFRFNDELNGYAPTIRVVYRDGFSELGGGNDAAATLFETFEGLGCTKAELAFEHARYYLKVATLRPGIMEVSQDVENLVLEPGDLFLSGHFVNLWGSGQGRITALAGGDPYTSIDVDDAFPMESGKNYAVRIRSGDGSAQILANVDTVAGDQTTLTFETSQTGFAVGDLVAYGEQTVETIPCIVRDVEMDPNLGARITFVEEAPEVHNAGPIPPYDPRITNPPINLPKEPPLPVIIGVVTDEQALIQTTSGAIESRIELTFQRPGSSASGNDVLFGIALSTQTQIRVSGTDDEWSGAANHPGDVERVSIGGVFDGVTYDVRARYVTEAGMASSLWTTRLSVLVLGRSQPPPDVQSFWRKANELSWRYPDPPLDLAGFEIRDAADTTTDWDVAIPIHEGLITTLNFNLENMPLGQRTYFIKALDTSGNYSVESSQLTVNIGDPVIENIIETVSHAPTWPGDIRENTAFVQGGVDSDGYLHSFPIADNMYGKDQEPVYVGDDNDFFYVGEYTQIEYRFEYTPDSEHLPAFLLFDVTVTGAASWVLEWQRGDWMTADDVGSSEDFWPEDRAKVFWGYENGWQRFPGKIRLEDETYKFRIRTLGKATEAVIEKLDLLIDVVDVVEDVEDFAIAVTTGTRLSLSQPFRGSTVDTVQITVQDDGGTAVTAKYLDKAFSGSPPNNGPLIKCYDSGGTSVAGTIDATVKGK